MKNLTTPRRTIISVGVSLMFLAFMLTGTYRDNITENSWTNAPLREIWWLWQAGIIIIAILCWMIWSPREPRD